MDAAFEAYVGLFRAGLVNKNLLPLPSYDEEAAKAYAEVSKRPAITFVNGKFDPWPAVAAAWQSRSTLFSSVITFLDGDIEIVQMKLISPCRLPQLFDLMLYLDARTSLRLRFGEGVETIKDEMSITIATEITKVLLLSVFSNRMKEDDHGFPLLFIPNTSMEDPQSWLEHVRGTYDSTELLRGVADIASVGIVRDTSRSNKRYVFQGVEKVVQDSSEIGTAAKICLKVKKFPKRTDFLHRVSTDVTEVKDNFTFLDPQNCRVDRLPMTYSQFAMFLPSVMHHVENALLTDHLYKGVLAPIGLSSPAVVFPALCTPAAKEDGNYQRLEFLGDSILKTLTSVALMADHLTWHEGYLSHSKDHIVSNGRLAAAAQENALDKYILTKPFTGKKWKPLSNARIENSTTFCSRKMSTKTLADVVEALIGAVFLDGGFPKALSCLKVLLPEVSWLPLAERNNVLHAVSSSPQVLTMPSNFMTLEALLGHTFTCKSLLLEAVTHPSHLSVPSTPSYQRLEYLGDAILDYLVTTAIFSHENPSKVDLQPSRMHILRATAVNASFLAFCSLSRSESIPVAELAQLVPNGVYLPVPAARSISLSMFLRHAPTTNLVSALTATHSRFAALQSTIDAALSEGLVYPWRAFAAFAPEKVFSDMIEAVLGAVYIDTGGDFKACDALVRRFGIMDWLETAITKDIPLRHPKEDVGCLAPNARVKYHVWIEQEDCASNIAGSSNEEAGVDPAKEEKFELGSGRYRCKLLIGEREICTVQGWNRIEVETAAAEEAIRILSKSDDQSGHHSYIS